MDKFEELLSEHRGAVERFVRFRVGDKTDSDDILQEVYISAYKNFASLRDTASFKPWLITIARNKCNDYFRRCANICEIPLDDQHVNIATYDRFGRSTSTAVSDTIEKLGEREKQILYLSYWREMPQADIAKMLDIPLGTVKSRLYAAKERFREIYPSRMTDTGSKTAERIDNIMKTLPEKIPEHKIVKSEKPPFDVKFEELPNWFIIPRFGEKVTWGTYEAIDGRLSEKEICEVTGKILLHGIEGVEIKTTVDNLKGNLYEHHHYVQLTDKICRWLGKSYTEDGIRKISTFLDGDEFWQSWGWGEDNCGAEINMTVKGDIIRNDTEIKAKSLKDIRDIVGRYTVTVAEKVYDTVCVMTIYENGAVTESYVDINGRSVLWRRFNRNDWKYAGHDKSWTELFPNNERIIINGETYVHWYDCISDYILE